jgi:hypothetical protein
MRNGFSRFGLNEILHLHEVSLFELEMRKLRQVDLFKNVLFPTLVFPITTI